MINANKQNQSERRAQGREEVKQGLRTKYRPKKPIDVLWDEMKNLDEIKKIEVIEGITMEGEGPSERSWWVEVFRAWTEIADTKSILNNENFKEKCSKRRTRSAWKISCTPILLQYEQRAFEAIEDIK